MGESTLKPSSQIPRIEPMTEMNHRPFWSVMIPTFNCAHYLRQTLLSVLSQDPGPEKMQIEVVDDVSTKDYPEEVVQEIGKGRVQFHRHPKNIGASRNFNACIMRSQGRWIQILHGDDYVLPGFYSSVEEAIFQHQDVALFTVRSFIVDEQNNLEQLSYRIPHLEGGSDDPSPLLFANPFMTPGVIISRSCYEQFGGFREHLIHVADWEMFVRAVAHGRGLSINRPLVAYRSFQGNDTSRLRRTATNLRDELQLLELFTSYSGFDTERFRVTVLWSAYRQMERYRTLRDHEAVRFHRRLIDKISTPGEKCRRFIRHLLNREV